LPRHLKRFKEGRLPLEPHSKAACALPERLGTPFENIADDLSYVGVLESTGNIVERWKTAFRRWARVRHDDLIRVSSVPTFSEENELLRLEIRG